MVLQVLIYLGLSLAVPLQHSLWVQQSSALIPHCVFTGVLLLAHDLCCDTDLREQESVPSTWLCWLLSIEGCAWLVRRCCGSPTIFSNTHSCSAGE